MKKLSIILTLALLCTLFTAFSVSAELSTTVIDGITFYEIGSTDDYVEFVNRANVDLTVNGILTADIDLSEVTVTSIGVAPNSGQSTATSYQGIFDGNGHIIRNMSISRTFSANAQAAIAMFNMTDGATIKNLGIENATITNKGSKDGVFLSALVGRSYGTSIDSCYVKNSTIVSNAKNNYIQAGGPIAAYINSTTVVSNCYSTGNTVGFSASGGTASGGVAISCFVGWLGAGTGASNIINSYARGNSFANRPSGQKSAGFARVGSSGNTDTQFINSYTDKKTNFDASTTMGYYATDAEEWSDGTVLDVLNDGTSAWKADTYGVNGGAPRLLWEADPTLYDITVENAANGTVSAPAQAPAGVSVELTVTPDPGYSVDWIKVNGTEIPEPYSFEMPAEDVTITASFSNAYAITVTAPANGAVVPSVNSAVEGTTVTLTVTPDFGYAADWVKVNNVEISLPYSFEMPDGAVTVTAQFSQIPVTTADGVSYYQIGTPAQYASFATMANTDLTISAVLTSDIDLSGWNGISIGTYTGTGDTSARYSGIFDGNRHVIRNLSISKNYSTEADKGIAMFNATYNSIIKDLGLENAAIQNTGAKDGVCLAGLVCAAFDTSIENCYVKNSNIVSLQKNYNIWCAGTVAGFINGASIVENCYATGNNIGFRDAGGTIPSNSGISVSCFVGYVSSNGGSASNIVNCYSAGNTLLNVPPQQKNCGFARLGTSGNTDVVWTNSYTDKKAGFDAASTMGYYARGAAEWRAPISEAYAADFDKVNGGYPMLVWETTAVPSNKFIWTGVEEEDANSVIGIKLIKYDDSSVSATLYAAVYSEGILTDIQAVDFDADSEGEMTVYLDEPVLTGDGKTLKVFVWNGLAPYSF